MEIKCCNTLQPAFSGPYQELLTRGGGGGTKWRSTGVVDRHRVIVVYRPLSLGTHHLISGGPRLLLSVMFFFSEKLAHNFFFGTDLETNIFFCPWKKNKTFFVTVHI